MNIFKNYLNFNKFNFPKSAVECLSSMKSKYILLMNKEVI